MKKIDQIQNIRRAKKEARKRIKRKKKPNQRSRVAWAMMKNMMRGIRYGDVSPLFPQMAKGWLTSVSQGKM